ncbi:MAG: helix-turn-helix domain-containing protein [Oleispira sp.]|nr:helix-turn-helix domain-containing protein [Oleispira sp.]
MSQFSTTTANQLWGFTHYLQNIGIDVKGYLQKHQLPLLLLDNPQMKISTRLVYLFIDDVAIQENLPLLGWHVGQQIGWQALENVSLKAAQEPTLYEAFKAIINFTSMGASHADFFLVEEEDFFEFCHVGGVALETPGYFHIESYLIAVLVDLVRSITTHNNFSPEYIKLRSTPQELSIKNDKTSCLFQQGYTAISIPNSFKMAPCRKPARVKNNIIAKQIIPDFSNLDTFKRYPGLTTLSTLLVPYLLEGTPTLQLIADIGQFSVRSLQRHLSQQGCHFNQLVQELRIDIAKCLLADKEQSIANIAQTLQYQQTTHFIRAFKKQTATTPKQFQKSQLQNKKIAHRIAEEVAEESS